MCATLMLVWLSTPVRAQDQDRFRSPTGNIGCIYYNDRLRCDVIGGIRPLPPQPHPCEFGSWAGGYVVSRTGRARPICTSDSALGMQNILRYGKTWSGHGIVCKSAFSGVTCTNTSHHGFFISKGAAHTF